MTIGKDTTINHLFKPLNEWLEDKDITEIAINQPNEVWIEKHDQWTSYSCDALSFDHLNSMATAVASFCDNNISVSQPILSATLPKGERIQFVIPPACSPNTVSITIRKPNIAQRTLNDYVQDGFFNHVIPTQQTMSPIDKQLLDLKDTDLSAFLKLAINAQKTIVIAGGTGSGKTTFMKMLVDLIPKAQRIITIEDVSELFLPNTPNKVHLFYPSEATQSDPVTSAKLLKSCLRMKPDRILLAELRGAETFDFVNIAASGHGGSITSCHAGSVALTFERLAAMMMKNPEAISLPYEAIVKLLHQVIDIVIHIENDVHSDNPIGRHITEVWFKPNE
ncbi:P-type DNA transfer ATPase VirB11 [Aliivibrio fischeri]|uniref:Type IV secretion system protein n=1 Tax=Aliivibrio fischeri TaxID=668 RepID=H2ERZ6_ALIFS|nr:P-type DNA transfer ATPase VirB11 [Aliivibrio fischeri]AEY78163.1 ATPase provides energy for both assembly of type IV secretion complex and secretion of T-DNA complex (VirB11) [Aliivibrio fischeri]